MVTVKEAQGEGVASSTGESQPYLASCSTATLLYSQPDRLSRGVRRVQHEALHLDPRNQAAQIEMEHCMMGPVVFASGCAAELSDSSLAGNSQDVTADKQAHLSNEETEGA